MPSLNTILVVEDDPDLALELQLLLEDADFTSILVAHGHEALVRLNQGLPQAILLDLNLPRLSGIAVLEWVRQRSTISVLVISGSALDSAFTNAFALGADDFLRKPFSGQELLVRLRTRLGQSLLRSPRIQLGNRLIDWAGAEIFCGTQPIVLTALEFQLLSALYQHRDRVLSRAWLLENVWHHTHPNDDRVIDATVKRLRRKIGTDLIQTVRGLGFRLSFV